MLSVGVREVTAALRVLARGELARYGSQSVSEVQRFEDELRAAIGVQHALAVNSGTSALVCALVGAGIGPGDEVLVPAYTWVSTAAAPLAVGAVPVLVDIDESLTMDPVDLKRKITPHSRAVIPVHMINLVCDMDTITGVAAEHSLVVIEDACQAIGVTYRGRAAGSIGHAGAFSFNQHKNIRSGEGGAVLTDDARLFARAGMYHDVGSYERPGWVESEVPLLVGQNFRMPELSAAVLRPQLGRLGRQMARRRERRRLVLDELAAGTWGGFSVAPHHDPGAAVGLALTFEDPAAAQAFAAGRGARRLIDTGRHVHTNWRSIRAREPVHPRFDPYAWAHREIDQAAPDCPRTLDLLARTCTVELAPELPTPVFRRIVRQLARPRTPPPVAVPTGP
jgi:dTDP-4-amino-4,6-dideoxygalactose transaminase